MAKRFTDTNKYRKQFLRGLKGPYKLLWDFLYHECEASGIWTVDFEVVAYYLGKDMKVNKEDALEYFNSDEVRIVEFDRGKKWFIPSFIEFQYGHLSEANRAHTAIILSLKKYDLIDEDLKIKPLQSPLQGGMVMVMDKDMVMDMVMVKDKEGTLEFSLRDQMYNESLFGPQVTVLWEAWIKYKKTEHREKYKSLDTELVAINNLFNISNGDLEYARKCIENSMANRYRGIIPPKQTAMTFQQGDGKQQGNRNSTAEALRRLEDEHGK
jgi:hypothetical protein